MIRRTVRIRRSTLTLATLLLCLPAAGRVAAVASPPASPGMTFPVRPDQALVYVIRPADPGGGDMVADYFFAGEQLLAVTKGKTHGAAYLPPGKHLLWCQGGAALLDLVPGQTYHVVCGFFHGFSLLDDAEEAATLLAETKPGPEIGPGQREKARKRFDKFYPAVQNAIAAEGWDQPSPPVPADKSGLVRVPAY